MSKSKRPTPAIYREPPRTPATAEGWRAFGERLSDPDPLGTMLAEWGDTLREFLAGQGVPVEQSVPLAEHTARLRDGKAVRSVDGGHVWYRKADVSAAALEAIDALAAVESVRRAEGDRRALAAFDLGAAIERLRATQAFAAVVDSYRRSHRPAVTQAQVRAAVNAHPTRIAAADALGISTRRLQTLCGLYGIPPARNRKSTISDS